VGGGNGRKLASRQKTSVLLHVHTKVTFVLLLITPHHTKQDQEQIGRFILAALENGPSLERDD